LFPMQKKKKKKKKLRVSRADRLTLSGRLQSVSLAPCRRLRDTGRQRSLSGHRADLAGYHELNRVRNLLRAAAETWGKHPILESDANMTAVDKPAVSKSRLLLKSRHATDLLAPSSQGEEVGGPSESHAKSQDRCDGAQCLPLACRNACPHIWLSHRNFADATMGIDKSKARWTRDHCASVSGQQFHKTIRTQSPRACPETTGLMRVVFSPCDLPHSRA